MSRNRQVGSFPHAASKARCAFSVEYSVSVDSIIAKVIEALEKLRPPGPTWPSEAVLLAAIETELRKLGVRFLQRTRPPGARPELMVDSAPNLLLGLSLSGDWRKVAVAAAQLCIDQKSLPLARPVVVLGSPADHAALKEALTQLGITALECG